MRSLRASSSICCASSRIGARRAEQHLRGGAPAACVGGARQLAQLRLLERAIHHRAEVRELHRLGEKTLRARLHRLHGERDVAVPGDHDDHRTLLLRALEDVEAGHVGQEQVEQHDRRMLARARARPPPHRCLRAARRAPRARSSAPRAATMSGSSSTMRIFAISSSRWRPPSPGRPVGRVCSRSAGPPRRGSSGPARCGYRRSRTRRARACRGSRSTQLAVQRVAAQVRHAQVEQHHIILVARQQRPRLQPSGRHRRRRDRASARKLPIAVRIAGSSSTTSRRRPSATGGRGSGENWRSRGCAGA